MHQGILILFTNLALLQTKKCLQFVFDSLYQNTAKFNNDENS